MPYIYILDCNDTLGTCCHDYGIVPVLDIIRKFFDLFSLIIPILLMVGIAYQLIRLVIDPEEKGGNKKFANRILAAVLCFMLPTIFDAIMGMMGSNETFQVAACWEEAKISNEVINTQSAKYIDKNKKPRTSFLINPGDYKTGTKPSTSPGEITNPSTGTSTANGKAIVSYAKQFVGQRYIYGGTWNGELPYTGTDCSGFVQGVFRHFGISLNRTTSTQWADKSKYDLVSPSDIRAGDLIMYDGHVGILTGNGTEIVHAKGTKYGVVLDPDYRKCSSHAILGIMRIKGV